MTAIINGSSPTVTFSDRTTQAKDDAQAVIDTKASALAKLAALGLTQDEVKALIG
jgi:hypothetical protein